MNRRDMLRATALALPAASTSSVLAQAPIHTTPIHTTYFTNNTQHNLVLCIGGFHGAGSFFAKAGQTIPVAFHGGPHERILAAFQDGMQKAVCYFPFVPAKDAHFAVQVGATQAQTASGPKVAAVATNNAL